MRHSLAPRRPQNPCQGLRLRCSRANSPSVGRLVVGPTPADVRLTPFITRYSPRALAMAQGPGPGPNFVRRLAAVIEHLTSPHSASPCLVLPPRPGSCLLLSSVCHIYDCRRPFKIIGNSNLNCFQLDYMAGSLTNC